MKDIDITKINLRNDIVFKYVFASGNSKDILIHLLNAVFLDSGQEKIADISYMNPMNLKEYMSDKATVIDIKARDEKGRLYNIEMQVQNRHHFMERIVYYNAKLLTGQLSEAQGYDKLNKTVSIIFSDFLLIKNEKAIHNIYRLLNVKSHKELADLVEYHFIELPKYKDERLYDDPINQWLFALMNGETFINDPGRIPERIKKEAMIMKAIKRMQKAAADPDVRAIIEYREKAARDEADRLSYATEEALLIGEKRGKKREKETIALKLLSMNMTLEEICMVTGLTELDIMKLKQ